MPEFKIKLQLLDPLVLSSDASTTGEHAGLDFIPGATLRGVAASRLYGKLDQAAQWDVFHSGRVRFGNARIVTRHGDAAMPMPYCWHGTKGIPTVDRGRLDSSAIHNLAAPDHQLAADQQPVQLRDGYLAEDGGLREVLRSYRLKTAINPGSGRAAESQLFGYSSINGNQQFVARLQWDDELGHPDWAARLQEALSGTLRLGRSRTAQYGRVDSTLEQVHAKSPDAIDGPRLTLWLISDLCALGAHGQPSLLPALGDLVPGLPGDIPLDCNASFLRIRRYAPFNSHRRLPEPERQVITAGSVLSYDIGQLDASQRKLVAQECARGLGLYRECGLGEVLANHPLLAGARPGFAPASEAAETQPGKETAEPQAAIVAWLKEQATRAGTGEQNRRRAEQWAAALGKLYRAAMALVGADMPGEVGPSRSQWGQVRALADQAGDMAQLRSSLFDADKGYCRPKTSKQPAKGAEPAIRDSGWPAPLMGQDAGTFGTWLEREVFDQCDSRRLFLEFARLATKTVQHLETGRKEAAS